MADNDFPFILSASRRTDIPAFYSEWFIRRLREGRAKYIHPYTKERIAVPLTPKGVAGIVFWTKDFGPMLQRVDEMEGTGYRRWLVHYTITGLGPEWEPRVPETAAAISTLLRLSERIGAERIYWRFDPMVFTKRITVRATLDRFARLTEELKGAVAQCYTSVMQHYRKIEPRLADYEECHHDLMWPPTGDELIELAAGLAEIGRAAGISVHSCCTPALAGFGIQPARCIDAGLIIRLWPEASLTAIDAPSRPGCGCHRAIDIGAYDTCPHRCLYCYANASDQTIAQRHSSHHPDQRALMPDSKNQRR